MGKKKSRPVEEVNGNPNMSPMIDCCFLLLIFFVVNATALTVSKDPSINMPSAVSCSELKDANGCIVVNIFADAEKMAPNALKKYQQTYKRSDVVWGVADSTDPSGSRGFSMEETQGLTDYISKQKEFYKNKNLDEKAIRIYLRGDMDAPWERTAAAIRCAAAAGVSNMVFGTLPARN